MKTTVAVLGAGGWGSNWTERALRDPECEVRALADSNPKVLDRLAARGIPRSRLFTDAGEALAAGPTDVVTCSIPNPSRVPYLMRALQEGRHVLVDKPLVHTVEEVQALLEHGHRRKSAFMVAQNYRWFAGVRRVRQMLEGGSFGRVAGIHAHFLRSSRHIAGSYVSQLPGFRAMGLEMCIHHFDMMRYFLGAEPETVSARAWRTPNAPGVGFDGLDVHLEFAGGVRVAYDATWGAAHDSTDWNGHWEVLAERGTLSYGYTGRALRAFDTEGRCTEDDPGLETDVDTAHSMDHVWMLFKEQVFGVQTGHVKPRDGFCPLEDNVRSLGIALAAARSVDTGAPVNYDAFMRRHFKI